MSVITMELNLVDHYGQVVSSAPLRRAFMLHTFTHLDKGVRAHYTRLTMAPDQDPAVFDVEPSMADTLVVDAITGRVVGLPEPVLKNKLDRFEMFAAPGTYTVEELSFMHVEWAEHAERKDGQ